jgi:hypothetical protein
LAGGGAVVDTGELVSLRLLLLLLLFEPILVEFVSDIELSRLLFRLLFVDSAPLALK